MRPAPDPAPDLAGLLRARYGPDAPALPPGAFDDNPVLQTLLAHRSVRCYRPDPLPPGTLEILGAAAQSAASSSNLQVWSAVALEDSANKAEAAHLCGDQDFIRQAPLFLVFCADLARLTAASEREGLPGLGLAYFEMFLTAVVDAALAAQNTAAAAEGMGLGICYVGAARNRPRELAALLHLPPRVIALFGLAVGFPAEGDTSAVKPRLPQPGLLHRETYDAARRDEAVAAYDETMRGFYEAQQMNVGGTWANHSAKRVAGPEALSGREIWREVLRERGFELK
jgi:nitroreductase